MADINTLSSGDLRHHIETIEGELGKQFAKAMERREREIGRHGRRSVMMPDYVKPGKYERMVTLFILALEMDCEFASRYPSPPYRPQRAWLEQQGFGPAHVECDPED